MQRLTDLELHYLPMEDPAFAKNPFAHFAAARAVHPWLAKTSFGYALTQHRAMREMIRREDSFVMGHSDIAELMGARGRPWGEFIANNIQGQTGDIHKSLREAVNSAFTPGKLKRHRPMMREVANALLDEWAPKGACDFEAFIANYPIAVLCRILGASTAIVEDIREALESLGSAFAMDPAKLPELDESVTKLDAFVRDLVAERRTASWLDGDQDLLNELIASTDKDRMSEEELYSLLIFLFGAGYDTSKNVLTQLMYMLVDRPEIYARCAKDVSYCRKVMNEGLRMMSPASSTRRVIKDFTLRDVLFEEGTVFMFPWSVSGRDETAVPDPDRFDPERADSSATLAFGSGPHICLGQFIAKAQIEEGLHCIARRMREPRIAGEYGWRPFPGVWGLRGLPITFTPESADRG